MTADYARSGDVGSRLRARRCHTASGARVVLLGLMAVACWSPPPPADEKVRPLEAEGPYDLPDVGYEKGDADADVVIIEFVDFACPACLHFARETLPRIEREWILTGRARLRVVPFDALGTGRAAAAAAECAAQQDAFWPMHDRLYERHEDWVGRRGQREGFAGWAAELGLDTDRFRACWRSEAPLDRLEVHTALARGRVPGTPAFLVNGRPAAGALPYKEFRALLEAASDSVIARAAGPRGMR